MKIYKDIEQHSEEWHRLRYGKIGGTRSKGLFTKTDTLLFELLAEKMEDYHNDDDAFVSKDMQRGIDLEPLALEKVREYTCINFEKAGWLQCEENELLGISPDGISDCLKFSVEIKCPSAKKYVEYLLNNEIPNDYIHQCLWYFVVNPNLKEHFFCSFRPENNKKQLFIKSLKLDTIVNLGTNAKPVLKTVEEWVLIAKEKSKEIQLQIEKKIKELSF